MNDNGFLVHKTPISFSFLLLCLVVSLPSAFSDYYFELFSGELPHTHWWQNFSMAFQHGAVGQPVAILVHLILNVFLLLTCGRLVEQLLGSSRFLILSIGAWVGFIFTQYISGIWINGSSGIIWAYSPFLLLPIQWAKLDVTFKREAEQAWMLLIVMWGIVTVAMGFVPLIFNPNHSLIHTFFFGNLFHFTATLVGFGFYFYWKNRVR